MKARSLLAPVLLALASQAHAQSPPGQPGPRAVEASRLVDVEVADKDKGRSEITRFTVAVSATGLTSVVVTTVGDTQMNLKVRRDGPAGAAYALEIERRLLRKPGSVVDLQLSSSATLDPDRRAIVGTVDRPDGSRTEIALTLH